MRCRPDLHHDRGKDTSMLNSILVMKGTIDLKLQDKIFFYNKSQINGKDKHN